MSEGMTGLNPTQAKIDIEETQSAIKNVASMLNDSGRELFETLEKNWCSPVAVEFSNKYSGKLYEVTVTNIEHAADKIATMAKEAYNELATAHQIGLLDVEEYSYPSIYTYFGKLMSVDAENTVGMNVEKVKAAMIDYQKGVNQALEALDEVPTNIALYDPEGEVQSTYTSTINKVKEDLNSTVNAMMTELENNTNTETNTVIHAAEKTTTTVGTGITIDDGETVTHFMNPPETQGGSSQGSVPNIPTDSKTIVDEQSNSLPPHPPTNNVNGSKTILDEQANSLPPHPPTPNPTGEESNGGY